MRKRVREGRPLLAGFVVGIVLGMALLLGSDFYSNYQQRRRSFLPPPFTVQPTVSRSQIEKIALAVDAYTQSHGQRPARLDDLVANGQLTAGDLLDATPHVSSTQPVDPSRLPADELYFPGLRADDPKDLLLLTTLTTATEGGKLAVVWNDGRVAELTSAELAQAMQRTYDFLGSAIQPTTATSPSAAP